MFKALSLMVIAAGLVLAQPTVAQELPVDSVRITVPGGAGGGTDTVTRLFADFLSEKTGVTTAVTNQAAGGGVIATTTLFSERPDGRYLMVGHAKMHTQTVGGNTDISFRDLTPLGTIASINTVYVARSDAPFDTLPELISYAKEHPGEIVVATQASGTSQVMGEALNQATGGSLLLVDFGTTSNRIPALIGNKAQVSLLPVGTTQEYVKSGDLKALAVINRDGDVNAPEIPTATSLGVDIHFPLTVTLYGPPGMEPELVDAFAAAIKRVTDDQDFQERVAALGQSPTAMTPEETRAFLEAEFDFVSRMMQ